VNEPLPEGCIELTSQTTKDAGGRVSYRADRPAILVSGTSWTGSFGALNVLRQTGILQRFVFSNFLLMPSHSNASHILFESNMLDSYLHDMFVLFFSISLVNYMKRQSVTCFSHKDTDKILGMQIFSPGISSRNLIISSQEMHQNNVAN
jgi:hypothetical protein